MDNKKTLCLAIIVLSIVSVVALIYAVNQYRNNETTVNVTKDEQLFKTEYESNNNLIVDEHQYSNISIIKSNNIKYVSDSELVEILKEESSLVFIGDKNDEYSRLVAPILINVSKELKVKKIYYLEINDIRDELTLGKKDKVKVVKKGTDAYYELLNMLGDFLNPYYLYNNKGEKVDTSEKRITTPIILATKNGEIIGAHLGTVSTHMLSNDPYLKMTDSEVSELTNTITNIINKYMED